MTLRVTVAGSGTVVPSVERRQSCVVVETAAETLLFDLGSGALRGLLRAGIDPTVVDRAFVTHFHPDHTSDLVSLLFAINYGTQDKRTKPLRVTGPKPFGRFWEALLGVWGEWMTGGGYPLEISELPLECSSPLNLPGCRLSWAKTEHRPESIGYRLDGEGGSSFVYTGDTEYTGNVVELARDADTLLIECSFPDDSPVPGHLTPSTAARVASEANVRRVVLTHLYPPVLELDLVREVEEGFAGEVVVAEDGLVFEV